MKLAERALKEFRDNPRARWGLWLIAGILWFYGVLVLRDTVRARTDDYASLVSRIEREQGEASQREWLKRVEPARLLKVELEGRLWQADTVGLAQARFQDWLNARFREARVGRPRIEIATLDEKSGGPGGAGSVPQDLWAVRAKLSFDFDPASLDALLVSLERSEKRVVVESLVIHQRPIPRAEATVAAYFQKQASAPARAPRT